MESYFFYLVLITFCLFTASDFICSYFLNFSLFSLTDYFPQRKYVILAYFPCVPGRFFLLSRLGKLGFSLGSDCFITLPRCSFLFLSSFIYLWEDSFYSIFLCLTLNYGANIFSCTQIRISPWESWGVELQ